MSETGYTREGAWARAKSFGLVALITLLIWLLAESESLRTEKVRVEVQFRADPASGRLVSVPLSQDFSGSVTLRLSGPNARVDSLAAALRRVVWLEPGMEGVPGSSGEHSVNLETALKSLPLIRDSAVTVREVEPSTALIFVDELVTRDMPVRVVVPEGQVLDGSAEAAPATVRVTMPRSAERELGPDAAAIARLDAKALTGLPEGRRGTLSGITLELPEPVWAMEGVAINPPQVAVTLRLRSRVDAYTIPTVPVQLRLPIDAAGKYDLASETKELVDISVVGPIDLIAQIKSGRLTPVATVPLTAAELEGAATSGQVLTKEPVFSDFPTPLSFDTKQKVVRILVRKRETPSGSVPRN